MDGAKWTVNVRYDVNGTTVAEELESTVLPSMQLWPDGHGVVRLGEDRWVFYGKVYRMESTRGR